MVSIVQSAGYAFPNPLPPGDAPSNIPLASDPTPGNLIVCALPVDYTGSSFGINTPYWQQLVNQPAEIQTMNWFIHIAQVGDTAQLAPVWNFAPAPDGLTQYIGGAVWEIEQYGLLGSTPNTSLVAFSNSIEVPGIVLPALAVPSDALVLSYVQADMSGFPEPDPIDIAFAGLPLDGFGQQIPANSPHSYAFGGGFVPSGSVAFEAGFTYATVPPFFGITSLISAIAIGNGRIATRTTIVNSSTSLPCVPCCCTTIKIPY